MDKYLLQILLETNTIIIPTLGALTITDAKSGEMMFMPYLKYDDGKLAEYISNKDGIDIIEAKNVIAKYVREINMKLDQGETYDMFQFGRFFKTKDGEIDFERWNNFSQTENNDDNTSDETAKTEEQPTEIVLESKTDEVHSVQTIDEENEEFISFESEVEPISETVTEIHGSNILENQVSETIEEVTQQPSLDEILAQTSSESEIPQAEETTPEVEEKPAIAETVESKEKPIVAENTSVKSDPVVDKTPDPSKVQVENSYVSVSELDQKASEKSADLLETPTSTKATKKKKRKGVGFWILMILIFVLASGSIVSILFYDQVKDYIPFLEIKRAEIVKRSDSTQIAELLNESAEELENAEEARVESELNSTSESPTTETTSPEVAPKKKVQKPIAKPVEKPVSKPIEKPVVKPAPQKTSTPITENGSFHVIGGAFGEERNAIRYAEKLISNGNNAQVIGKYNGLYLVSVESFATASEASKALQNLESVTGKAWIFKKP